MHADVRNPTTPRITFLRPPKPSRPKTGKSDGKSEKDRERRRRKEEKAKKKAKDEEAAFPSSRPTTAKARFA